jgi:hypothetical protein
MVALGVFVLLIELAWHHRLAEAGLIVGLLIVTALAGRWLLRDLRVHPASFPAATASQGLRVRTEPSEADQQGAKWSNLCVTLPRSEPEIGP